MKNDSEGKSNLYGIDFTMLSSRRQTQRRGRSGDNASLATLVLFDKLIDITTLVGFGEKRWRKKTYA